MLNSYPIPHSILYSTRSFMVLCSCCMSPQERYPDISTSISGIPRDLPAAAKRLALSEGTSLKELYQRAVDDLTADLKAGESVTWPVTRVGTGKPYPVRLHISTLTAMREVSREHRVRMTNVFLAAVVRYLAKAGSDIEL